MYFDIHLDFDSFEKKKKKIVKKVYTYIYISSSRSISDSSMFESSKRIIF